MMQSARRAVAALRRLCALLALICLAGIALIILAGVLGRMVGILVPDTATISGMLLGMTVFLALAPTFCSDGHIRVELIIGRMHGRLRRGLELACLVVALCLMALMTYACYYEVLAAYSLHTLSIGLLAIPVWIPQSSMLLGMGVLFLSLLEALMQTLSHNRTASAAGHRHGDDGGSEP